MSQFAAPLLALRSPRMKSEPLLKGGTHDSFGGEWTRHYEPDSAGATGSPSDVGADQRAAVP